jgi:hypothetical protein
LSNSFSFATTSTAIKLSQTIAITDSLGGSDRFNRSYFADDFEIHREELTRDSSEPQNAALERLA